jgi:hypothetical protein
MSTVRRVRAISLLLALIVGALPMVPAEHVHESDAGEHHEALVHRHAAPHLPGQAADHLDHDGGVVDHDDDHTITLSSFFTTPLLYSGTAPAPLVTTLLPRPPTVVIDGPSADVEHVIHGPPRAPTGLRAPPSLSRL